MGATQAARELQGTIGCCNFVLIGTANLPDVAVTGRRANDEKVCDANEINESQVQRAEVRAASVMVAIVQSISAFRFLVSASNADTPGSARRSPLATNRPDIHSNGFLSGYFL